MGDCSTIDARAFLEAAKQPSADAEAIVEPHFEAGHLTIGLVDPDGPGRLLLRVLLHAVRGRVAISGEIERQRGSAVELHAPRIRDLHYLQDLGDQTDAASDSRGVGQFSETFSELLDALPLRFLFGRADGNAVLLHNPADLAAVHEEDFAFDGFGLCDCAVLVQIVDLPDPVIGVVLTDFIELTLMSGDVLEQRRQIGHRLRAGKRDAAEHQNPRPVVLCIQGDDI